MFGGATSSIASSLHAPSPVGGKKQPRRPRTPSTVVTVSTDGTHTKGASTLERMSTMSKRESAAVAHVHVLLVEQSAALRKVFREVDADRNGKAAKPLLRAAIIDALRLHPRWHPGLDAMLDLADPLRDGLVEFGRLMRLVRSKREAQLYPAGRPDTTGSNPFASSLGGDAMMAASGSVGPNPWGVTTTTGSSSRPATTSGSHRQVFVVDDDKEDEVRRAFDGVNTGDKQLIRRIGTARTMPPMRTCARTTNILGDSRLRAPWAVAGDDERMNHILSSIHDERFTDLVDVLRAHASPSTPNRLTHRQLIAALRAFDPFIHDAEVLQYFSTLAHDSLGTADEKLQCADGTLRTSAGAEEVLPAWLRTHTVDVDRFVAQYGKNVLAAPNMRCSANFALKWKLPAPRAPPKAQVVHSARERRDAMLAHRAQQAEAMKLQAGADGGASAGRKGRGASVQRPSSQAVRPFAPTVPAPPALASGRSRALTSRH